MVSEALQAEGDEGNVDLSGLHNVSQKVKVASELNESEPPPEEQTKENVEDKQPMFEDNEMTFTDTLSLNSVMTDGYVYF